MLDIDIDDTKCHLVLSRKSKSIKMRHLGETSGLHEVKPRDISWFGVKCIYIYGYWTSLLVVFGVIPNPDRLMDCGEILNPNRLAEFGVILNPDRLVYFGVIFKPNSRWIFVQFSSKPWQAGRFWYNSLV